MTNYDIRNELPEDAIVFDNPSYDNSIVGLTTDDRVVYDYDLMVKEFVKEMKESDKETDETKKDEEYEFDAIDFINYNTIRALNYNSDPRKPVVYYKNYDIIELRE